MIKKTSTQKHPFFGKTKELIDCVPFMEEGKFVENWIYTYYFFGIKINQKEIDVFKTIRNSDLSMSNDTFSFLKDSNEFLNIMLNNINSCVMLLNKDLKLAAFNDVLKTIFSNKKDEDLFYKRCGESIGCAFQIEEQKECGQTSKCNECELRLSALSSYNTNESIYKNNISRPFFDSSNNKIIKHLQFSTHLFHFHKEKYVVLIVEDVSRFFDFEERIMN